MTPVGHASPQYKQLTHIDFFKTPIMRSVFLPNLQKLLFSNTLESKQSSKEHLKTIVYAKLGGANRVHRGQGD